MALGDSYNGGGNTDNNKKQFNSPEVYSGYNTSNDTGVDPSALSYSFWNGLLKVSIAPMLKNPTDKYKWDHKNASSVYLSHRVARILHDEAKRVINGEIDNGGSRIGREGKSLITFSNGKEIGCGGPCLIIRNVESDGTITGTYVYEFRRNYSYGVTNFRADTSSFDKTFYDDIEVDEFMAILEEFYTAMTKATAYTVIDEMKYNVSRLNTKIGLVAEALGVEFRGGGDSDSGSRGGTSYFDNDSNSNSSSSNSSSKRSGARQTTLDGIGGAMNPPEDD